MLEFLFSESIRRKYIYKKKKVNFHCLLEHKYMLRNFDSITIEKTIYY